MKVSKKELLVCKQRIEKLLPKVEGKINHKDFAILKASVLILMAIQEFGVNYAKKIS